MKPPAPSILLCALFANASAATNRLTVTSPWPRILTGRLPSRSDRRPEGFAVDGERDGARLAAKSARDRVLGDAADVTTWYSMRLRWVNPCSFGSRMWAGSVRPRTTPGCWRRRATSVPLCRARRSALAGSDPAADAGSRLVRSGRWPQIVQLHDAVSSPRRRLLGGVRSSAPARPASLHSDQILDGTNLATDRWAVRQSTVSPIRCRPSARTVPRASRVVLTTLLVSVTRSLPAIGDLGSLTGRLAGDDAAERAAAPRGEFLGAHQAAEPLDRGLDDVHRFVDPSALDRMSGCPRPRPLHARIHPR